MRTELSKDSSASASNETSSLLVLRRENIRKSLNKGPEKKMLIVPFIGALKLLGGWGVWLQVWQEVLPFFIETACWMRSNSISHGLMGKAKEMMWFARCASSAPPPPEEQESSLYKSFSRAHTLFSAFTQVGMPREGGHTTNGLYR